MVEEGTYKISAPLLLTVEFLLALFLAAYLLYRYSNIRRQNPFVTGATLLVWFLSFVIIFLLPVDVSSAFYRLCLEHMSVNVTTSPNVDNVTTSLNVENGSGYENNTSTYVTYYCSDFACTDSTPDYLRRHPHICYPCFQPYSFVCPDPLKYLWYIIYWLFFILSWVVLPLGQSYVLASYFSIWKKILRALVENAIFYITLFVIFVTLFIYLLVKGIVTFTSVPLLLATASNTWGLLILTLLLGYGLVEVPRTILNASRRTYSLKHCYFKASKLYSDMAEADEKLKEVTERVKKVSQSLHYNDPLREYIDVIIKKFPKEMQGAFSKGHDDYEDYQSTREDSLSKSSLESLLKKTMTSVRRFNSSRIHWLALTDQTLDLEDVELNATSRHRFFKSSVRPYHDSCKDKIFPYLEWYWKIWLRPWVYRVVAFLLAILSITIVWSEVTFSIVECVSGPCRLSIFAVLVYTGHVAGNYVAVELLSVLVVAYLSICAYFTVFKIRIFNLYYLAPRHSTDEYSLLFSAVLLSRLALPICLNYLYMIQVVELNYHEEAVVPDTAFAEASGTTDLVTWLTSYFYIYYPALILLVCIATLLSLGSRIFSVLGYQKFIGQDDFSADFIDEGKALMKRERRIRERNLREHGRATYLRSEIPSELLREHRPALYTRRLAEKTARTPPEAEDDSTWGRFTSKAKRFAVKSKETISAKYSQGRRNGEDDVVELLPISNSETSSFNSSRLQPTRREPPRGIFDDV